MRKIDNVENIKYKKGYFILIVFILKTIATQNDYLGCD